MLLSKRARTGAGTQTLGLHVISNAHNGRLARHPSLFGQLSLQSASPVPGYPRTRPIFAVLPSRNSRANVFSHQLRPSLSSFATAQLEGPTALRRAVRVVNGGLPAPAPPFRAAQRGDAHSASPCRGPSANHQHGDVRRDSRIASPHLRERPCGTFLFQLRRPERVAISSRPRDAWREK
ncbi:hypothetical protein POSPLADRAFT_1053850 [Postia placenta MAD-698-R-SB12]|uniref:Uncharacterized protein n=1 Tax=Postia placenta MAD-698-R-SB12 TaxID=670580 RepID=A0A1X6N8X2_9APHY|nr:hypothetical protein POSPLADRAFT_1053850 [Postia placenta MAD-698-R-SB12]OSX65061.1 hypothetical protein POSPLADRAFT_1053850 [Postia placenta MAD-698-R-SB12]